jgi:hypothetical protein
LAVILERPTLIGVGIDESTALEVRPDGVWTVRATFHPATGVTSLPR